MTNAIQIPLGSTFSEKREVYIGSKHRPSSATSISLLSEDTLVCCNFNECTMYLVKFDMTNNHYEILHRIDTTYNGVPVHTDLMSSDSEGRICVSNFVEQSASLYKCRDGQLIHDRDVRYKVGDKVHGVKFYNSNTIALTSRKKHGGVHLIDINKNKLSFKIKQKGLSVQDVCFFSEDSLVTISTLGSPDLHPFEMYDAVVHEIELTEGGFFTRKSKIVTRELRLKKAHLDNVVFDKNYIYFTDQYNNKVIVVDRDRFEVVNEIGGYDFPHGVDVNYGLIAVTNYGSNTITIRQLYD